MKVKPHERERERAGPSDHLFVAPGFAPPRDASHARVSLIKICRRGGARARELRKRLTRQVEKERGRERVKNRANETAFVIDCELDAIQRTIVIEGDRTCLSHDARVNAAPCSF